VNYVIDPFERGKVWFIYSKLEREFIETTSYVALETVHKDVWSEKFGDLLIRIGSSVGSFFFILTNSFGSAITFPHFLHLVVSNGSYIGIKTWTILFNENLVY